MKDICQFLSNQQDDSEYPLFIKEEILSNRLLFICRITIYAGPYHPSYAFGSNVLSSLAVCVLQSITVWAKNSYDHSTHTVSRTVLNVTLERTVVS